MSLVIRRAILGTCLMLYSLSNTHAALSSTSTKTIMGNAPSYKALDMNLDPVEGGKLVTWDITATSETSLFPGIDPLLWFILSDDDGDQDAEQPYGKRTINGQTGGAYFTLIDPKTGLSRDIQTKELSFISQPNESEKSYFLHIPHTWVGAQIGLEFTPFTPYGYPNIGTTYTINNPYNSSLVHILTPDNPGMSDSIIRMHPKTQVGIWDAADITKLDIHSTSKAQQIIPTDPVPYSFSGSANSPQLGHTYTAILWEDWRSDGQLGGFATNDFIIDQIGTKTFYTWKLIKGNGPANGSIIDGTVITLVTKSTDNSITLPVSNTEALAKWPGVGLPTSEAGLQGFTLEVEVDWEFNLSEAPPKEVTRAMPTGNKAIQSLLKSK